MARAECPHCFARFRYPDSAGGQLAHCPRCEKAMTLPEAIPVLEEVEEEAPRPRRRPILARGITGEVELLRNSVVIRRRGFRAWLAQGSRGDKEILLSFISGIEFRAGGGLLGRGYIRFLFMGSTDKHTDLAWEARSRPMRRDLSTDENTVVFNSSQRDDFEDLKEAVEERINELRR